VRKLFELKQHLAFNWARSDGGGFQTLTQGGATVELVEGPAMRVLDWLAYIGGKFYFKGSLYFIGSAHWGRRSADVISTVYNLRRVSDPDMPPEMPGWYHD
jgi:hypothetical protein